MIKKTLYIFLIVLLLTVGLASAASLSDIPEANILAVWDFESDGSDSTSHGYDLTEIGTPVYVANVLGNGVDLEYGDGDGFNGSTGDIWPAFEFAGSYSICNFIKLESIGSLNQRIYSMDDAVDSDDGISIYYKDSVDDMYWVHNTDTAWYNGIHLDVATQAHTCFVYDTDRNLRLVYKDGVMVANTTASVDVTWNADGHDPLNIGIIQDSIQTLDGILDQLIVFNIALDDDQVAELAEGVDLPFTPDASDTFNIYAYKNLTTTAITDFWAYVDGTNYSTSNGTIITSLYQNDTNVYNITIGGAVSIKQYFTEEVLNRAVDTNVNQSLIGAKPFIRGTEGISRTTIYNRSNSSFWAEGVSAWLSGVNVTNSSSDSYGSPVYYLDAGEYDFFMKYDGYYLFNDNTNISALEPSSNIGDGYDNILTINLKDIITEEIITKTSFITINGTSNKTSRSISDQEYNNTNGTISFDFLQGEYALSYYATDYATGYTNITIDEITKEINISLYANNSLWVTAQDLDTGDPLTNFTVNVYDDNRSYVFNDNLTGTARENNIISGVYIVKITKDGYTSAEYPVTITGGSHQNLVAYLQSGATETVFTVQDLISTGILEGATSNQYKLINSSYVLISSQLSDITGRVQFNYVTGNEYKFTISLDDYDTRTFLLTPLFSSYTIRLTPSTTEQVDTSGGDWIYYIAPNEFYNGEDTNYTISISSGTGTLINYTLDVSYSFIGTTESETCSNAYGCSYDYAINVTGTSYNDYILVNYTVYETGRSAKTFSQKYYVIGGYNEYTLKSWSEEDATSGVGDLEKGFIATTILLIVIGAIATAASFVGAPPLTTSGIALTVLIIIMASVGFVPNYVAWVVAFGGLLMAIFGRGNY